MSHPCSRLLAASIAAALSVPALGGSETNISFIVDGDTFFVPFEVRNISDAGIDVTRLLLDLTSTGTVFDTVTGGDPNGSNGVPFTPQSGSDFLTGLDEVTVVDGGSTLELLFSDFQPDEAITFNIDVDNATGPNDFIRGNNLIGALVTADFTNGVRLIGELQAITGNPDASGFNVTETTTVDPVDPNVIPSPAAAGVGLIGGAMLLWRRRKTA